mmetsp:Transcript_19006/g.41178  ORF Transcript_19006/g.41178 Transcript_19006/m.41178 type:complete len:101 (+) Transcript_19006:2855-3157(+)
MDRGNAFIGAPSLSVSARYSLLELECVHRVSIMGTTSCFVDTVEGLMGLEWLLGYQYYHSKTGRRRRQRVSRGAIKIITSPPPTTIIVRGGGVFLLWWGR